MASYKPLISVIIPTFNVDKTLAKCLDSIIDQTYLAVEIWVIDGESKDRTLEIVKERKEKHAHLYYVSEKDNGIYDAMNKGIEKCKGDWLLFMGADDYLYNHEVLKNIFESEILNGTNIIYGNIQTHYGPAICKRTVVSLMESNICHQAIFYTKSALKKYGGYNLKYKIRADNVMNIQLFCDEEIHWQYKNETVSFFSVEGLSNQQLDYTFLDDLESIYLQNFSKLLTNRQVYIGLRAEAFVMLKYYKFWKGISILWKSGGFIALLPDILYCIKVRLGITREGKSNSLF